MNIQTILKNRKTLVDHISDLDVLGSKVLEGFNNDDLSREGWKKKIQSSMELALQISEKKNTPWTGASNIKLPILSIASLQFSSRVYPALISGTDIVRMRTTGQDDGKKAARAKRVSQHMSYQVLEEDEDWEEEMDRLLITLPIVGCSFKKSYFDKSKGYPISIHVMASDLVVNYFTKSLETAPRITHIIPLTRNEVEERFRSGVFRKIDLGSPVVYSEEEKNRNDLTQPYDDTTPFIFLEQCCYEDLDGDGYAEPYVITILRDTSEVVRVVPRFREKDIQWNGKKVVKITGFNFYTKYSFIPSPDGGFYDVGFGQLLGPMNKSADSIINQLVDAGSLANRGGGFIGRGARLKKGSLKFEIGEWKQVNSSGTALKENMVTLPFKEPSSVLFQLLSFTVGYVEKLSSVSDMMVGRTPGQNTPATTSMSALQESLKVFSAIYKRIYRGMKNEFKKRYLLNQEYLDFESYFTILDSNVDEKILLKDYSGTPTAIRPSADPAIMSDTQRLMRADVLSQRAAQVPGYNRGQVELRYLEAMNIEGVKEIFNPDFQPPPDPNLELETQKLLLKKQEFDFSREREMMKIHILESETEAKILKLEAGAVDLMASAESREAGQQIDQYKHDLETLKLRREVLNDIGGMAGMGGPGGNAPPKEVPQGLPGTDGSGMG